MLFRPFVLLSFKAPEYEMDATRGIVRWRIEKGVLVSKAGRGRGYLEIDVQRRPPGPDGRAILHVEVEVANFYPSLASGIGNWFYANTQSRIHVIVTHGFLRSLARLDLAESRVGRFATRRRRCRIRRRRRASRSAPPEHEARDVVALRRASPNSASAAVDPSTSSCALPAGCSASAAAGGRVPKRSPSAPTASVTPSV